jgi:hypothetical protein
MYMKMESFFMRRRQKGIALVMVLVIMLVLAIGAVSFLGLTNTEMQMTRRDLETTRAFYVAQGSVEKAVAELRVLFSKGKGLAAGDLAEITPPNCEDFTFNEFSVALDGEPYGGVLECGTCKGLRGMVQKIKIIAKDSSLPFPDVKVRIREDVEAQFIPIFQFAIFYTEDLEILPGPPMTVLGPVHCNKDIYIGSDQVVNFDSPLTCVGNIYHYRKDATQMANGAVRIKDADGVYRDMLNPDGTWLDSNHPDWAAESTARWDGNVASAAHNVPSLGFPLATPERPRAIIERGQPSDEPEMEGRYYYRAELAILDDVAYNKSGALVSLSYPVTVEGGGTEYISPISTKSFYNYREGKTINVTEVDVAKLQACGHFPANGILYVSRTQWGGSTQEAVRLVNGAELPPQGLTVVTDNPLYIKGDYNTVNKKPASVMCDAINILSNNWLDEHSSGGLNQRLASYTEVNVAIVAGNTVTVDGQYNGGVENMLRFLEKWDGVTLRYHGSLVAAWNSEIATGDWLYGGFHYTAPNRDWSYDTDLGDPGKAPPGVPCLYTVEVAHWQYD